MEQLESKEYLDHLLSRYSLELTSHLALLALSRLLAAYVHVVLLLILIMNVLNNCCMLLMILYGHENYCFRGVY
jgi:hypothetical protein